MTPDLQPGDALPERRFGPISRTDIVRYQGASGDFNPIHHDEPFARTAGYETVISVGMLAAGYAGTYCVELFGAESVRELRVRFQEVVTPGASLTCRARVTELAADGEYALELRLETDSGAVALTGTARVRPG